MKSKTFTSNIFNILLHIGFTVFSIIIVYPFWHILVGSLTSYNVYISRTFQIIPKDITFQAYKMVFQQENIGRALIISSIVTILGTSVSLFITTIAAYALSKKNLKGGSIFIGLTVFTMLFSGGIIPLYFVMKSIELIDTIWAMILPPLVNAYYFIIMRSTFVNFPVSLEEAAKMEGCNEFHVLFRIVIPLSLPVIATIGLFYSVNRWNDFFLALMFINDTKLYPLQVIVYRLVMPGKSMVQSDASYMNVSKVILENIRMASVIIASVPILFVYPFIQKYFSKGVMIGAIKG